MAQIETVVERDLQIIRGEVEWEQHFMGTPISPMERRIERYFGGEGFICLSREAPPRMRGSRRLVSIKSLNSLLDKANYIRMGVLSGGKNFNCHPDLVPDEEDKDAEYDEYVTQVHNYVFWNRAGDYEAVAVDRDYGMFFPDSTYWFQLKAPMPGGTGMDVGMDFDGSFTLTIDFDSGESEEPVSYHASQVSLDRMTVREARMINYGCDQYIRHLAGDMRVGLDHFQDISAKI